MLQLNCSRKVSGTLRGYDPFMNLVIEDAFEEPLHEPLGSVVLSSTFNFKVIRGNTVIMIESVDRL